MLNNSKKWTEYIHHLFPCILHVHVPTISWALSRNNAYIINGHVRFVVLVEGWGRPYKLIGENPTDHLGELHLGFCPIKSAPVCKAQKLVHLTFGFQRNLVEKEKTKWKSIKTRNIQGQHNIYEVFWNFLDIIHNKRIELGHN